jgi:hypothetical protein
MVFQYQLAIFFDYQVEESQRESDYVMDPSKYQPGFKAKDWNRLLYKVGKSIKYTIKL